MPDRALTDHLERRTLSGGSLARRSKRFDLRKEYGAAWLQDLLKPQVTLLALGLLRYDAFFGKLFAEPSSEAIQARYAMAQWDAPSPTLFPLNLRYRLAVSSAIAPALTRFPKMKFGR